MEDRRDLGESLIEILLAIAVMGACAAAVLGGIATTVRASDINRQQAVTTNLLRAVVEDVQGQPWQPCATSYTASPGVRPAAYAAYQISVTVPQRRAAAGGWTSTTLPCTLPGAVLLQDVRIVVTPPDARAADPQAVQLYKRKD